MIISFSHLGKSIEEDVSFAELHLTENEIKITEEALDNVHKLRTQIIKNLLSFTLSQNFEV